MKISKLVVVGALLLSVSAAEAGWFGASFGPAPSVTVFGQTLSVPVPSVVLGPAAGASVAAKASSGAASLSLPWFKVSAKSPTLTVGVKGAKINVSTSGVKEAKPAPAKKKSRKSKK